MHKPTREISFKPPLCQSTLTISPSRTSNRPPTSGPSFLAHDQIAMIAEALRCVGDYGEVKLVVQKGMLRFITISKSIDVRHWETEE